MPHVMFGGLVHEQALRLATRLCALVPGGFERVFFSDSGSVAVEVALKMAVQFWLNKGVIERGASFSPSRAPIMATHSRRWRSAIPTKACTASSVAFCQQNIIADLPRDRRDARPFDALVARHADDLAGIIVEPLVQGAGGMIFHEPQVLQHIRAVADKHDLLLIFDEIFTGFGRTGTLFAARRPASRPTFSASSKALTGGTMSLAATLARATVFEAFWSDDPAAALMHGPTFMANALACAAANASLDLFETEPRLAQVASDRERRLLQGLAPCRGLSHVADVRVKGAIGVVELANAFDLEAAKRRFVELGVFIRPFGRIIYLTPAFTISPGGFAAAHRCGGESHAPN